MPGKPIPFTHIEEVLGPLTDLPPKLQEWVTRMKPIMEQMLGVNYCHYAIHPETREPTDSVVSMAVQAGRKALAMAGLEPTDVDLLVYGGISVEYCCPPTTVLIQQELRIPRTAEYSIHSNCTSTYKAMQLAADQLALGRYKTALICSSQLSSPFLRAEHFNQKILEKNNVLLRWFLSDGAGALVMTRDPESGRDHRFKVRHTYVESIGLDLGPDMYCYAGGHRSNPLPMYENGWHHLTQNFDRVAKLSVDLGKKAGDAMMERTGLTWDEIKYFVINVPTKHIFDQVVQDLRRDKGVPNMKFFSKLADRGYPGPCAIFHAIDDFLRDESPEVGDILASVVAESSKWMYGGFAFEYLGKK
jgi:3-oxoacyl-[acyl-carrier-protein] synthase III